MKTKNWIGRVLLGIGLLFMTMDAITHVMKIQPVIEAFSKLSIPEYLSVPLGILVLVCLVLFMYKPSRILSAVLLTGYLGGAVAIHLRAGSKPFEVLFPVIIGFLIWCGLYLLDHRARLLVTK